MTIDRGSEIISKPAIALLDKRCLPFEFPLDVVVLLFAVDSILLLRHNCGLDSRHDDKGGSGG